MVTNGKHEKNMRIKCVYVYIYRIYTIYLYIGHVISCLDKPTCCVWWKNMLCHWWDAPRYVTWVGLALRAPQKKGQMPDAVSGCRAPEIHGIVGSKLNWLKSIFNFNHHLLGYPILTITQVIVEDQVSHVYQMGMAQNMWSFQKNGRMTLHWLSTRVPGFDPSSVAQTSSAGGISNSRSTKCGMGTMLSFSISMSFWSGHIKRFLDGPSVLMCCGWLEGWYLQQALSGTCLRLV